MARVKGVFYTLSGFFLVMLVLVLSLLVADTLKQSNTRLTESGSLERVYVLSNSLNNMLSKLDNGMEYSLVWDSNLNVTHLSIKETLDSNFNDYASSFNTELQSLATFVENDQSEILFDESLIFNSTNKVMIIVKPNNLRYTHLDKSGENALTIYPGTALSEVSFAINLTSESLDGNGIVWSTQAPGDNFSIEILVSDASGNTDSMTQLIDESVPNIFTINGDITISVGEICHMCIQLDRGGANITSTFSTPLIYVGEQSTINYPKGTYKINFSAMKVFLNSTPRIL